VGLDFNHGYSFVDSIGARAAGNVAAALDGKTASSARVAAAMAPDTIIIVTAHEEADRLPDTLAALATAFPGATVVVADDGSTDGTS
jgi:Glycosyl transferase family 2